jgi:hypothetical protein
MASEPLVLGLLDLVYPGQFSCKSLWRRRKERKEKERRRKKKSHFKSVWLECQSLANNNLASSLTCKARLWKAVELPLCLMEYCLGILSHMQEYWYLEVTMMERLQKGAPTTTQLSQSSSHPFQGIKTCNWSCLKSSRPAHPPAECHQEISVNNMCCKR